MLFRRHLISLAVASITAVGFWASGCNPGGALPTGGGDGGSGASSSGDPTGNGGASGTDSTGAVDLTVTAGSGGTPCTGLACQIHACAGGGSTTISGTIYDPAGKNPLYGIVAYVPNTPPSPFPDGATCASCADLYTGSPIASAVTDAAGHFTIKNAPDGIHIPLVIQVGKWRRQLILPSVAMCQDDALGDHVLTLPSKASPTDDIPNIAISTGMADTLECLLSRIGIDKSEYVPGAGGGGHIHIFQGEGQGSGAPNTSPPGPDPAQALWSSAATLKPYDILILSCEGHETTSMNQQALYDYTAAGGRVFASHFHYAWFNTGPFGNENLATWSPGGGDIGKTLLANIVTTLPNNQPFPKGQAMLQWLMNVGALQNGELPIEAPRHNADVSAGNLPSQGWIVADQNSQAPGAAQDFSFDTPFGVPDDKKCGRVVFSDMHVGAASGDYNNDPTTPSGCANQDLSPQEKALEFILFDLSACLTPNDVPVLPPPPT